MAEYQNPFKESDTDDSTANKWPGLQVSKMGEHFYNVACSRPVYISAKCGAHSFAGFGNVGGAYVHNGQLSFIVTDKAGAQYHIPLSELIFQNPDLPIQITDKAKWQMIWRFASRGVRKLVQSCLGSNTKM